MRSLRLAPSVLPVKYGQATSPVTTGEESEQCEMSETKTWSATVLTLFPEMFPGPLGISLLGKALANELWSLEVRDIRDHGLGKHRSVDDTPAGGGPGMVMRADVAVAALDAVYRNDRPLISLSPRRPGVPP